MSIKYLSRDNKLIMNVLDILKTAIPNTFILSTIEYLRQNEYFQYAPQNFKRNMYF